MTPATAEMERLVEARFRQLREVPGLVEWRLPIGAAWLRLLGEGRPSTVEQIASVLGWPAEEVAARLAEMGVEPDPDGRVAIAESAPAGVPLPVYRIRWLDTGEVGEVPGCAGDALTPILEARRPARVELPCPATGRLVSVQVGATGQFEGVGPAEAVAVLDSPDSDWHPRAWTRADCADGLVFASAEAATSWLGGHPGHITVAVELFVRTEVMLHTRLLAEARRLRAGGERGAADHR